MSHDIPITVYSIRLTGDGVRPTRIAAGELATLIIAAEKMILEIARRNNAGSPDEIVITLNPILDQSIGFAFASTHAEMVRDAFQEAVNAIKHNQFDNLPAKSLEGLNALARFSREKQGHTLFLDGSSDTAILDLPPEFVVAAPEYISGETTIYGRVERVGGVQPKVRIRTTTGDVIFGDVTESLCRTLATHLYTTVALRGQATWDIRDWTIADFKVLEVLPYEPSTFSEALKELHAATGGAFDHIEDVDAFALAIREGEEA